MRQERERSSHRGRTAAPGGHGSSGQQGTAALLAAAEAFCRRHRHAPQEGETKRLAAFCRGRSVLVTGAGGSIGSALCHRLITAGASRLVLVDHAEHALYEIDRALRRQPGNTELVPVLGTVLDEACLAETLHRHRVDTVLHAAAYKHVPLVETNPLAGLRNNVFGTRAAAEAAQRAGVERFLLVSSDKAVRPAGVMGASKRLAEFVIQDMASRSRATRFSIVRFGNVLGSTGSVVPLFAEQIATGGPVTLTDDDATRYFMTVAEAARLVLLAASTATGGEVFVLDMGAPVRIRALAEAMIRAAGLAPGDGHRGIEIRRIGLRPGERLHEEAVHQGRLEDTPWPGILRAREAGLSQLEVASCLRDLDEALKARDESRARAVAMRWASAPGRATVAATDRPPRPAVALNG